MRTAAAVPSLWRGMPFQKVEGARCRSLRAPAEPRASSRADLPAPRCPLGSGAAAGSYLSRQPGRGCPRRRPLLPKGAERLGTATRGTSSHLRTDLPTQRPRDAAMWRGSRSGTWQSAGAQRAETSAGAGRAATLSSPHPNPRPTHQSPSST